MANLGDFRKTEQQSITEDRKAQQLIGAVQLGKVKPEQLNEKGKAILNQYTPAMQALAAPKPATAMPMPTKKPVVGETGKIYSGGKVSDIIDTLLTVTGFYPTTGAIQAVITKFTEPERLGDRNLLETVGHGVKEGVKNRAMWRPFIEDRIPASKKELFNIKGVPITPSFLVGTPMDVALDPAWVATPIKVASMAKQGTTAAAKAAPTPVKKAVSGVAQKAVQSKPGQRVMGAISEHQAKREMLKKLEGLQDEMIINIANDTEKAVTVGKQIAKLDTTTQIQISKYMEAGTDAGRQKVLQDAAAKGLNAAQIQQLGEAGIKIDTELGQKLVDAGVMKPETFEAWKGRHLRRTYQRHEDTVKYIEELKKTDPVKANRIENELIKQGIIKTPGRAPTIKPKSIGPRQALTKDAREALGEIEEAGYRVSKGGQVAAHAAAKANFLRSVADEFGENAEKVGFIQMPESKNWGALSGKWVPQHVYRQLQEIDRLPASQLEKVSRKAVGAWKFGKVILNPATHARNIMSNMLLADWGTGLSPARMDVYYKAAKDVLTNSPMFKEAKQSGSAFVETFVEQEIPQLLTALNKPAKTPLGKVKNLFTAAAQKAGDVYQLEELIGKMAVYRFNRVNRGMSPKEAAAEAEKWLFNYRKVPWWVERLRSGAWGPLTIPFLTFPYKALPAVGKAMLQQPARITRWFKYARAVEGLGETPPGEREVMPEWMREGNWVRLPVKDEHGRSLYFDLTYIIPFSDIGDVGNVLSTGGAPGFATFPFIDFVQDLQRNQSRFTGREIYPEGATDTQKRKAVIEYAVNFIAPPLVGGSSYDKLREAVMQTPDWEGRTRNLNREIASALAGLKTRPISRDEELMWRTHEIKKQVDAIKKNLRSIAISNRLSEEEKNELWDEGMLEIQTLLDQYDRMVNATRGNAYQSNAGAAMPQQQPSKMPPNTQQAPQQQPPR